MTAPRDANPGGRLLLAATVALALCLAGCGGGRKAVCEDPAYGGREDGRDLALPDDLSQPRESGRFSIPPIAAQARGEVDPRCTAFPPRIAGVGEDEQAQQQREAAARRRQREQDEAAAAMAMAGDSAANPREAAGPPAPSGASVRNGERLYEEVYDLVAAWAQAWEDDRLEDYLANYADGFRPPQPLTRGQWEETRARRMGEGAQAAVRMDTLEVYESDAGPVARFVQDFAFEGIESEITKELVLARQGGEWRILAERVVDVR